MSIVGNEILDSDVAFARHAPIGGKEVIIGYVLEAHVCQVGRDSVLPQALGLKV